MSRGSFSCCAFNCTNSTQKQKNVENIRNWQMLDFFLSLKTMQISIMPRGCENESSVCDGLWPVVWEEVLPRLNRVMFLQFLHSQNIFSENVRKVELTPTRDVKSSETLQTSTNMKLFTSRKKQDVEPELMDYGSKEEYSAFEGANTGPCTLKPRSKLI